jgi:endoglucanase Acf2
MHIHGIQWLPITPASQYLATLPNFAERNAEILRAHPNPSAHEWGDLYTAHLSYFDPEQAVRLLPVASKNQAMKSSALLYHTVYRNLDEKR